MFTLIDLPYSYDALEPYIDEATMHLHHDKHHQAYVDNLNKIVAANPELEGKSLEELTKDPKTKNMAGGVWNHNLFWTIMAPVKETTKFKVENSKVLEEVNKKYGDFVKFKDEFNNLALKLFGSGWIWLTTDMEIITTPNQDSILTLDKKGILSLDVWEHSYYLKYQNRRKDYIEAWWNVVNWKQVEENAKIV